MIPAPPGPEDLAPTKIIDSAHPAVQSFAAREQATDVRERAVHLFYAVRDGIRYDPYGIGLDTQGLAASTTLARGRGWCVPKAVLLTACCRANGIPARVGFADVRNHLSTERLRASMGTDVFYWHGYAAIYLSGRWVKATPAFNIELCEKFRLRPLDFDGEHDAIYHPFDLEGRQHMEYLKFRGEYSDVPLARLRETYAENYNFATDGSEATGDFDAEVDAETAELVNDRGT